MSLPETVPIYLVDAFAEGDCRGNPAAVCLLDAWPADAWLQNVAAEMNQAETAFLVANGDGFDLRWLTPKVEVDLCGHATLASAFVLWQAGKVPADSPIAFATRSGTLRAAPRDNRIVLDFPLTPQEPAQAPPGLLESLGANATYVGRNADYLVEVASEDELQSLKPDFRLLSTVACRGVVVTCRSASPGYDFASRFFAPTAGIDEDSVTGSAHCTLAHYWQGRLDKTEFLARQLSPRGGIVGVAIAGDRVRLSGKARLTVSGTLHCRSF